MTQFQRRLCQIWLLPALWIAGNLPAAAEDPAGVGVAGTWGAGGAEPPARTAAEMLEGVTFFGDMRMRYEGIFDDTAPGNNRGRLRIRLGLKKSFGKYASFTFRGASGATTEATSTNQTLTGNFTQKEFNLDQAYGSLRPGEHLELIGGKMPMPFFRTDLLWDSDLNPEGLAQKMQMDIGRHRMFVHLGQFIFNSSATTGEGYLLGFQIGHTQSLAPRARLTVAPAYTHVIRPNSTLSAGLNGNRTNAAGNALISDFRVINLPITIEQTPENGKPFAVEFDFAHNTTAKSLAGKTYGNAFLAEISYGELRKRGDWLAKYRYARIEADAVLSAFNDSDFSFTDSKGHRIKLEYAAWEPLRITATGYFLRPVQTRSRPDRTRVQVDATLSF